MDAQEQKEYLKKKLQLFLSDLMRVSLVRGFFYFTMSIRGREEVLVSVKNDVIERENCMSEVASPLASSFTASMMASMIKDLQSNNLPYDEKSLVFSYGTQLNLSGYSDIEVGLPPASPTEKEITQPEENHTLFLLAAYGRYRCPYVWVRSNHERLVRFTSDNDKNSPLRLRTSCRWAHEDIKVWDILAELIRLCSHPPPNNPFTVDIDYFERLPPSHCLLATGAMVNFLNKVILAKREPKVYTAKVLEDLQRVTKLHLSCLQAMAINNQLPVYNIFKQNEAATGSSQSRETNRYAQNQARSRLTRSHLARTSFM